MFPSTHLQGRKSEIAPFKVSSPPPQATPGSQHNASPQVFAAEDHRLRTPYSWASVLFACSETTVPHTTQDVPYKLHADFSLSLHTRCEGRIITDAIHQLTHLSRAEKCPQQGLGTWSSTPLYWTIRSSQEASMDSPEKRHLTPFRVSVIAKSLSLRSPCVLFVGR